jgi:large subunit ribosomal protein L23
MGRNMAKRKNWKKAIVTLQEGDDIVFFDESKE